MPKLTRDEIVAQIERGNIVYAQGTAAIDEMLFGNGIDWTEEDLFEMCTIRLRASAGLEILERELTALPDQSSS